MFEQSRREVQKIPEVLKCHLVSGDFDYLIDQDAHRRDGRLSQAARDILLQLPGAAQLKSYVVMGEIKETLFIPVEQ